MGNINLNETFKKKIFGWQLEAETKFSPAFFGLSKAKNIIDFVVSEQFLGIKTIYPFQFSVLVDFLEIVCPYCNNLGENGTVGIMDRDRLFSLTLLENGICPKCQRTKLDLYKEGKIKFYNELIGAAGTKAGKTTLVGAMLAPYIFHQLLFIPFYREWIGLIPWVKLLMVFIATSREQVKRTAWDYFISVVKNSPWFSAYFKCLDEYCKNNKINKDEIYTISNTSINIKWLNLEVLCLHSNAFSIAGGTFVFCLIDEIARFERGSSKRSADEIYRVAKNNLVPVREGVMNAIETGNFINNGDIIDGILAVVSAPLTEDDKLMRLIESAKKDQRRFVFHRSSFDINPNIRRNRMASDEEEDPDRFLRDFDAAPASAGVEFIGNIEIIKRLCEPISPVVDWGLERKFVGLIGNKQNVRIKIEIKNAIRDRMSAYFIHADPGRVNCSFGIVIGKLEGDEKNYKIKIVNVIDISIPKSSGNIFYEIDFESVKDFILNLANYILIAGVSYDRWNSVPHIQALRDFGLDVDEASLKYEDYLSFRQDLFNQRILFPMPEREDWFHFYPENLPSNAKLLRELQMLRDFGRKIDHPPAGSSDLAVCAVGVHRLITKKMFGNKSGEQKMDFLNKNRYNIMRGRVIRLGRFI